LTRLRHAFSISPVAIGPAIDEAIGPTLAERRERPRDPSGAILTSPDAPKPVLTPYTGSAPWTVRSTTVRTARNARAGGRCNPDRLAPEGERDQLMEHQ
jgi:hypothetical protein